MTKIIPLLLGVAIAGSAAAQAPVPAPRETSIPFAAHGGIRDFERESETV